MGFLMLPFEVILFGLLHGEGAPEAQPPGVSPEEVRQAGPWLLHLLLNPRQGPSLPTWLLGSWLLPSARSPRTVIPHTLIIDELEYHLLQSSGEDSSSLGPPTSCLLTSLGELCSTKHHFSLARMKNARVSQQGDQVGSVQTRNSVPNELCCEF